MGHILKGRHLSPKTEFKVGRINLWKGHKWNITCPVCGKNHGLNPMVGKKRPDLVERNKSLKSRERSRKRLKGKVRPKEWCDNISKGKRGISIKKVKRDGYYGNHNWITRREPNKSENLLTQYISENNLPFEFTGNTINKSLGVCPDFTHKNLNNVFIEYDCFFWHPPNNLKDIIRNNIYSKNNCKVLILNEKDLAVKEDIIKKIGEFCNEVSNTN